MSGLKASPRSGALGSVADFLKAARRTGDEVWIPGLGGLGRLMLGKAPEELDEWSYGNAPMRVPEMSSVPQLKRGRAEQVADTLFAAPLVPQVRTALAPAGRGMAKMLKRSPLTQLAQEIGEARQPISSVVKQKGGNWLSGSVEDALSGLKRPLTSADLADMAAPTVADMAQAPRSDALNSWIDQKLAKYVKNEMATPEDPIRALAEKGPIHADIGMQPGAAWIPNRTVLGKSGQALNWEALTDQVPRQATYRDHAFYDESELDSLRRIGGQFAVDNPTAQAYAFSRGKSTQDLGFNHLIDELSNAINPASGLPQHLQFPADRLQKVTVPQAVERVAQINAWRVAQKAEADALRANNAATVLHKEYPEGGMRWVELRAPGEEAFPNVAQMMGDTKERALQANQKLMLQDALKYEGDTMGHCVGGYCDDVLSGRTKIYSLRDAKGQPHVTVEVAPPAAQIHGGADDDLYSQAWEEALARFGPDAEGTEQFLVAVDNRLADLKAAQDLPPRIVQIKGSGKKDPGQRIRPEDAHLLPYVQDFVRSGKWSDVGDLQNAGMRRTRDALNDLEQKTLREQGHEFGEYLTDAELAELQALWNANGQKFAKGGKVDAPPDKRPMIVGGVRGRSNWNALDQPVPSWDIFSVTE